VEFLTEETGAPETDATPGPHPRPVIGNALDLNLMPAAADSSVEVAATALIAIGLLETPGTGGAVPVLEAALDDPRDVVRRGAGGTCGQSWPSTRPTARDAVPIAAASSARLDPITRSQTFLNGTPVGESLLFFGFRHPDQDYLYQDELREFEKTGAVRVIAVPSRVPGKPKTYVQDGILERGADVWRLIEAGAVIFVCGNANTMAPAVRRAFTEVFRRQTGKSQADADAWLAALRAEHRYLEDIWGG
jgi:hypothetical protein